MSPSVVKQQEKKVPPQVSVGEFVRVVYEGSWTGRDYGGALTIGWDSKEYILTPNKDAIVPFAAAANAFGDPRSDNVMKSVTDQSGVVSWVVDRKSEIRRLRNSYNNLFGDEESVEVYPNVKVYTLDGDELPTVLNDQSGDNVLPAAVTVNEQSQLRAAVESQRQMIETLMQRIQSIEGTDDLPDDNTPTTVSESPKSKSKPKPTVSKSDPEEFKVATTHDELPEDEG